MALSLSLRSAQRGASLQWPLTHLVGVRVSAPAPGTKAWGGVLGCIQGEPGGRLKKAGRTEPSQPPCLQSGVPPGASRGGGGDSHHSAHPRCGWGPAPHRSAHSEVSALLCPRICPQRCSAFWGGLEFSPFWAGLPSGWHVQSTRGCSISPRLLALDFVSR